MNLLTRFFSNTKVKYDVMNKLMSEIEARDDELQNQINVRVTDTELTEFAQTINTELLERDARLDEINLKNIQFETKNTEQDNAISNKVNNSTFTSAKAALEESIATKLSKDTYATDKAATDKAIAEKTTTTLNGSQANVNFIGNEKVVESVNGKKFASNTEIITTPTGVTEEERYTELLKSTSKEFTSNGSPIVVNNGIAKQRVLSGKLEGSTVKNLCPTIKRENIPNTVSNTVDDTNMIINVSIEGSLSANTDVANVYKNIEPNKTYILKYWVYENTINSPVDLNIGSSALAVFSTSIKVDALFTGAKEVLVTSKSDLTNTTSLVRTYILKDQIGKFSYSIAIFEAGTRTSDKIIPFGLSSTQAVITANGLKYSFYSNNEDKLANRVIALGGLEGARNTLEIKEDGSAIYTQNSYIGTIGNTNNITFNSSASNTETSLFRLEDYPVVKPSNLLGNILSDKYGTISFPTDTIYEGVCIHNNLAVVPYIRFKNTTLSIVGTDSDSIKINKLKTYLTNNAFKIIYILATPIIATIDKSLVPTILTQATNTFKFGEGVAPYGATIQVPCIDDIKKSYDKLVLLNGYTQTVGTATPVVNLLNTGLVRLQMDLTAPSTLLNATLFSVAPELRPATNAKIPIFVNGVCVLGVVDKATGNVNLPSIPSANSNIYIKTDYRRDI